MLDKVLTLLGTLNSIWGSIMGRIEKREAKVDGRTEQQLQQFAKTMEDMNEAGKAMLNVLDGSTDHSDTSIQRYKRKENIGNE